MSSFWKQISAVRKERDAALAALAAAQQEIAALRSEVSALELAVILEKDCDAIERNSH